MTREIMNGISQKILPDSFEKANLIKSNEFNKRESLPLTVKRTVDCSKIQVGYIDNTMTILKKDKTSNKYERLSFEIAILIDGSNNALLGKYINTIKNEATAYPTVSEKFKSISLQHEQFTKQVNLIMGNLENIYSDLGAFMLAGMKEKQLNDLLNSQKESYNDIIKFGQKFINDINKNPSA